MMWKSLADKAYRHAYAIAHVGDYLAMQIHSMRTRRVWTQKKLAGESGNTQPQISKFETSCEGVTLTSLHKLAEAFDVALIVKFVPFSQLAKETMTARADNTIPPFDEDSIEAISFPSVKFTMHPQPRRAGRNGGNENAYVRQFDNSNSGYAVVRS
jgi:transcriptional regulator with XRE-family HTH domain